RRGERGTDGDRAELYEDRPERETAFEALVADRARERDAEEQQHDLQGERDEHTGHDRPPPGRAEQSRSIFEGPGIHACHPCNGRARGPVRGRAACSAGHRDASAGWYKAAMPSELLKLAIATIVIVLAVLLLRRAAAKSRAAAGTSAR